MSTLMRNHTEEPDLLTQIQVSRTLGLSKKSTQAVIGAGALEPVYIPGLSRPKYRRADVEALVRDGRAGP